MIQLLAGSRQSQDGNPGAPKRMRDREHFRILEQTVVECRRCPRLVEWRERVAREKVRRFRAEEYWARPLPAFGDVGASLVVIGLAPAAHGGNRTGRMFTGDRSGDFLYEALHRFGFANQPISLHRDDGLKLHDCIITAAVRCAPPKNQPLPEELENCRTYLLQELQILKRKRVVVALGQVGFRAFLKAWQEAGGAIPKSKPVFRHGGEWSLPDGPILISSYHPSRQNTQTGRLTRPMFHRIFRRARQILQSRV